MHLLRRDKGSRSITVLFSRRLMQREITLHQRSEAETLLMEFTRAQMTHHCRGDREGTGQAEAGCCPDGWLRIQLN